MSQHAALCVWKSDGWSSKIWGLHNLTEIGPGEPHLSWRQQEGNATVDLFHHGVGQANRTRIFLRCRAPLRRGVWVRFAWPSPWWKRLSRVWR